MWHIYRLVPVLKPKVGWIPRSCFDLFEMFFEVKKSLFEV